MKRRWATTRTIKMRGRSGLDSTYRRNSLALLSQVRRTRSGFPKETSILDVGCGNCMLLLGLAEKGFTHLAGCDYSEKGVELGQLVVESSGKKIEVHLVDVLQENK